MPPAATQLRVGRIKPAHIPLPTLRADDFGYRRGVITSHF
jgi:hypothetical protein